MQIYITGATGRLGQEVLKLIPNAIPLVRKKAGLKNERVTDFSEQQLKRLLKDADVIIHLAASLNFLNPELMREANVELTKRIVNSTPDRAKIVYASSISVYGKTLAEIPADENTNCSPDTEYAKTKYEAEKIVLGRTSSIALRIGVIYGQNFEEYRTILKLIKKRLLPIIGDGKNYIPFVSVEDVAKMIGKALDAKPGVYLIADGGLTQEEIIELASSELTVENPSLRLSLDLALFITSLEEMRAKMFGAKPKFTKEHMLILGTNRVFDCSKAKKELGFKPIDLRKGIKEVINKMQL
ncbi:NAD(P)-dependent oxidoreductase [Candidatus Micrarchaeota archaeon]|nr:NAD(P)-dependent oxidoreductase [Candidatus Micrarchaeota archaeon]